MRCVLIRGHTQQVTSSLPPLTPPSHGEVTFTGRHSPSGGDEVNKLCWTGPDNETVAVDLFIKKWKRFGGGRERDEEWKCENAAGGRFLCEKRSRWKMSSSSSSSSVWARTAWRHKACFCLCLLSSNKLTLFVWEEELLQIKKRKKRISARKSPICHFGFHVSVYLNSFIIFRSERIPTMRSEINWEGLCGLWM